jgi:hypothetical protein
VDAAWGRIGEQAGEAVDAGSLEEVVEWAICSSGHLKSGWSSWGFVVSNYPQAQSSGMDLRVMAGHGEEPLVLWA